MNEKPNSKSIDGRGFEEYAGMVKKGSTNEPIIKTMSDGKWPSKDQYVDFMRKTGGVGGADTAATSFQFYDPAYFDPLLFFLQHRDRRELNFRLRWAYEYEPIVGGMIDLHRQLPLSDYKLLCRDKSIEKQFQDYADEIEVLNTSSYILGDYMLLGETLLYKAWDEYNLKFKDISLLPPEKIEVRRTYITKDPILLLHVDSELKRLVNSQDPIDREITKRMDINLVDQIKTQDRIVLPSANAFLFANKTSESDLRGTSILKRGLYALLLKYKMRILHNAYLDTGAMPIKIWKLGDASQKWIPSKAHFDALRASLASLAVDPNPNLIFHFGLQTEVLDVHSKWQDLMEHYAWADKELLYSLFGNTALLQSEPTSFSNSNISVRLLLSRYQMIRSQLELIWKNQIFRQMASARGYYISCSDGSMARSPKISRNGRDYYLDIPRFKWAKLNLIDDTAQKQFLMRLREKAEIPHKTICDVFDFDSQEIIQQLNAEEGTLVDPAVVDVKRKAALLPTVMSQVLIGRKSSQWVLPDDLPEKEAKERKEKKKESVETGGHPDIQLPTAPTIPEKLFPLAEKPESKAMPPESPSSEPGKGPVTQPPLT